MQHWQITSAINDVFVNKYTKEKAMLFKLSIPPTRFNDSACMHPSMQGLDAQEVTKLVWGASKTLKNGIGAQSKTRRNGLSK